MNNRFNYQTKKYFLSVFAGTGIFWSIGGLMSFSPDWVDYYMLSMLIGLMVPAIVAVVLIWGQQEDELRRDFKCRLFSLSLIRPGVFLFSLILMPLSALLSIVISLGVGGSVDQFQVSEAFSFNSGFVPVLLLLFLAALFEELGWRGYGFESLEKGRSFLSA
ncbi:MAG: CPBP family intramembrane glutamate endopeptidase, partial [Candidatus Thiodiazotropha taylori]